MIELVDVINVKLLLYFFVLTKLPQFFFISCQLVCILVIEIFSKFNGSRRFEFFSALEEAGVFVSAMSQTSEGACYIVILSCSDDV